MGQSKEARDRKREAVVAALLSQSTVEGAAKATGVGATTIYRWLQDAEFLSMFRAARRRALDRATARLAAVSVEAVEVLREVMQDGDAPPNARVSAARAVLDAATKTAETEDLSARVAELERLITAQNTGRIA